MNLIFLCNWPIDDVLTVSTVFPQLHLLSQLESVNDIIFITLESEAERLKVEDIKQFGLTHNSILWKPVLSHTKFPTLLRQVADFKLIARKIRGLIKPYDVQWIIAHGSPAGALALQVHKSSGIPFLVSSFEPHADYMLESGVWSRLGLKYNFQKFWESQQKKYAAGLMPVAEGYRQFMMAENIGVEKVVTVPCPVDEVKFRFVSEQRILTRTSLQVGDATVGIYVGKFGGLYYEEEAYQIFEKCFELISDFRLIILSPQPREGIVQQLGKHKIPLEKVIVVSVQHEQVAAYLSAADFAFATYKPGPSKRFLSPVKIGEYWANGLPVLLTEGVGDDSDIIQKEGGGATFDLSQPGSLENAIEKIIAILRDPDHRQQIPALARKYRNPDKIREAYEYFFGQGKEECR